jgi:hypothetical protein
MSDEMVEVAIVIDKNYDEKTIKAIQLIEHRAAALCWIHGKSASFYNILHKVILFSCSVAASVSGGNIFPLLFVDNTTTTIIILMSLIIFFTALTAGLETLGFNEKSTDHKIAAKANSVLHLDCIDMINRSVDERDDALKFINSKLKEEYIIHLDSPSIPNFVIKRYYKIFKTRAIPYDILMKISSWEDEMLPENKKVKSIKNRKCCTMRKKEIIPEKKSSMIVKSASIIEKMADLEDTCHLISLVDIQEIMDKYPLRSSLSSTPVKRRRHQMTEVEKYELEKFNSDIKI